MGIQSILSNYLAPIAVASAGGILAGYIASEWLVASIVTSILVAMLTPSRLSRLVVNSISSSLAVFTLPALLTMLSRGFQELLDILARASGIQGTELIAISQAGYVLITLLASVAIFSIRSAIIMVIMRRGSLL